jgi:hypothetical protein
MGLVKLTISNIPLVGSAYDAPQNPDISYNAESRGITRAMCGR